MSGQEESGPLLWGHISPLRLAGDPWGDTWHQGAVMFSYRPCEPSCLHPRPSAPLHKGRILPYPLQNAKYDFSALLWVRRKPPAEVGTLCEPSGWGPTHDWSGHLALYLPTCQIPFLDSSLGTRSRAELQPDSCV